MWRGDLELTKGINAVASLRRTATVPKGGIAEPPGGPAKGTPGPRYAKLSATQAARNLGLSSPEAVAALQKCAIGIIDKSLSDTNPIRDEYYWMSSAEARKVRGMRPASCFAKDQRYLSGERWLWDYSPPIEDGFDGFTYFVIFVCRRSFFIRIYPVRDKSAQTFITAALEPLRVFVRTSLPDTSLLSIWGDSD